MTSTGTPTLTARYVAGFPSVWQSGIVFDVAPFGKDGKLVDVGITLPNTTKGGGTVSHREVVGVRGGNKNLRVAA
jgi:hypothetical protein